MPAEQEVELQRADDGANPGLVPGFLVLDGVHLWPKADIFDLDVVADPDSRGKPLSWWPEFSPPCVLDAATIHDCSHETVAACLAAIGKN